MTSRRGIITKGGTSKRKVSLDFSDVEDWERLLREQPLRVDKAAEETEFKNAQELADRARRAAPRSRGAKSKASSKYGPLYRQIKAQPISSKGRTGRDAKVGIGSAFYGFFQERGAYDGRLRARPFMGPAIKKQRRPFQEDAKRLVGKLLRRTRR